MLDRPLFELIDRHAPATPSRVAVAVTELGSPWVAHALVLGGSAIQAHAQAQPVVPRTTRALAVVASGALVRHLLCRLIGRARPPQSRWRITPTGASFPSKHTTMATLAAAVLTQGVDGHRSTVGLLAATTAGAVGISRVRLGVHWPSDVLGGWLFGLGWPALLRWATRRGRARLGR